MTSQSALRALTIVAIAAAIFAGMAARLMASNAAAGAPFGDADWMQLPPGQKLGGAKFEGVERGSTPALRLAAPGCAEPVYAVPMLLTDVAIVQVSDEGYLHSGAYRFTDVYRGKAREHFSHWDRLIARAFVETYNSREGYFVRFYAPIHCELAADAYAAMAQGLMDAEPRAGGRP